MADGTVLNSGSGGDTLRTEDRTTFKTPVSIIDQGAAGGAESLVDSTNPLYTQLRSEQVDDAAFTPATSRVTMVGAEFDDTTPDSVDEGDGGALRMSTNRNLYVRVRDNAGNERGLNVDANGAIAVTDGSGSLTVDAPAGTPVFTRPSDGTTAQTFAALDLDTDLGTTTTRVVVGIGMSGAGGPIAAPGTSANGLDVDVTRVIPGTDATHLGKAEDMPASSGDTGVMLLAIRKDTAASQVDTDGDYAPLLVDGSGRLHTAIGGTVTVDNGGIFQVQVSSIAAGTNAIGKLAANSGVDIGDVDVTSVIAGTGATSLGKAEDAAHTTGDTGVMMLAVRQATASDLSAGATDGDYEPLQVDASGRLHVNAGTVTVASHAVTNAGTFAVQVDGSALTALQVIDNPVLVDDAAFTPATSSVMMSGFQADEASTDSVDEGDAGAARMTLDRKVIVNPQPHTSGGLSIFRSLDLDETEEEVKASAGQVYGWAVTNTATTTRWLKFYNATAANVTVGSTTPVITWGIPGNTSDDISANVMGAHGIVFDTAITVAATTGVADADTGAPSANDVIVNVFYK